MYKRLTKNQAREWLKKNHARVARIVNEQMDAYNLSCRYNDQRGMDNAMEAHGIALRLLTKLDLSMKGIHDGPTHTSNSDREIKH